MKRIFTALKKIFFAGTLFANGETEIRILKMMNIQTVNVMICLGLYVANVVFNNLTQNLPMLLITILCFGFVPILNNGGRFTLARIAFLAASHISIFYFARLYGINSYLFLFFLSLIQSPFILFSDRRKNHQVFIGLSVLISSLCFIYLILYDVAFDPLPLAALTSIKWTSIIVVILGTASQQAFWLSILTRGEEERMKAASLNQAKITHASRLSSLGEMCAGIAHEINNPLTIIAMNAELILKKCDQEKLSSLSGPVYKIQQTAMRISKIVKGLRSFARDESTDLFLETPISVIIEETLSLCHSRFLNRGIQLNVELLTENVTVECSSVQITQVLLNLLNNAFDALSEMIEAEENQAEKTKKWVKLVVHESFDWVEISVIDSGLGIPKHISDKLFQPFFTTKQIGIGTGIGLSISKGIIESHHGSLDVDTTSKNTKFTTRLPKKQKQSARRAT